MPHQPQPPKVRQPDYEGLLRFLLEPLVEAPESLRYDCERFNQNRRVWIRLALEQNDKGRVFGRGGRNIQAIRAILNAAAALAQQSVYLEIYGGSESTVQREAPRRSGPRKPPPQRRSS